MKNSSNNVRGMYEVDVEVNVVILAVAFIVAMAAISHWVIKMYIPLDPIVSLALTIVNGAVGAAFSINCKTWATQLSGFNQHERWNREQMMLVAIGAIVVLSTLGFAYLLLQSGNGTNTVFGGGFLLLTLPLARFARNATVSASTVNRQRADPYDNIY